VKHINPYHGIPLQASPEGSSQERLATQAPGENTK
jgi:hypothetical protein